MFYEEDRKREEENLGASCTMCPFSKGRLGTKRERGTGVLKGLDYLYSFLFQIHT
jgi:hypothetical protein